MVLVLVASRERSWCSSMFVTRSEFYFQLSTVVVFFIMLFFLGCV
jgi:hypothetical protein